MLAPQGLLGLFACSVSAPVRPGRPQADLSLPSSLSWPKSYVLLASNRAANPKMAMHPTLATGASFRLSPCHASVTVGARSLQPCLCDPPGLACGANRIFSTRLFLLIAFLFLLQALDPTSAFPTCISALRRSPVSPTPGCPLNLSPLAPPCYGFPPLGLGAAIYPLRCAELRAALSKRWAWGGAGGRSVF